MLTWRGTRHCAVWRCCVHSSAYQPTQLAAEGCTPSVFLVLQAGGFVSKEGRLNGRIMIARSFGDAAYKKVRGLIQR
jgi:hypothetical protein